MTPKIFIVILNWNGKENTLACLESIDRLEIKGFRVETIVVDNGSTDGSGEKISNFKFRPPTGRIKFSYIENKENLGYTGGNNAGIRFALENEADYIVLLNNDTIVDKNLISEMIKTAGFDKKIGIVAPKIYFANGYEYHRDRYEKSQRGKVIWYAGGIMDWNNVLASHQGVDEVDHGQYDVVVETDFASGCCMLIKREVFEKTGMLDDKFFLYYEDNDLCMRAKKSGFKVVYSPKSILWHKNAGSAGGSGSVMQDYYITRNRLLFGMRYSSLRAKTALIKESFRLLFTGRKWQKTAVQDFYLNNFGKGSFIK